MRCCYCTGGGWRQPRFCPGISSTLVLRDKDTKNPTQPQPSAMAVLTEAIKGSWNCRYFLLLNQVRRYLWAHQSWVHEHTWAVISNASKHRCQQRTTAQYRPHVLLFKIIIISVGDQNVHEEQVITLIDITDLFLCVKAEMHIGDLGKSNFTCFVWP